MLYTNNNIQKNNEKLSVNLKFGNPKKPDLHICVEILNKKKYCVIPFGSKSNREFISEDKYIKKLGITLLLLQRIMLAW